MFRGSSRRRAQPLPRASLWFLGATCAFLVAGGTTHLWGPVAYLLLVGFGLFKRPPTNAPNAWVNYGMGVVLLWSLAQLLPWTGQPSAWREALQSAQILPLDGAAALEPGSQILGALFLFAAFGSLFFSLEIHSRASSGNRRWLLEVFGIVIAILGALMAFMNYLGDKNPLATEAHVFTFLQNRNLCALLCAAGGVTCFALAYDRILRHPWQAAVFLLGAFACLTGVLSLLSRASLALFFLGCVLWAVFSFHQHGLRKRLKIIVPVGTLLVAGVFIFGERTVVRLINLFLGEGMAETPINRLDIWRDSLAAAPSTWFSGSGWGTFHSVVGVFRNASLSVNSLTHPENDYLWLLVEGGLPITVGFLLLVFGIWRMRAVSRARHDSSGRIVTVLAVLFCLQALVDTPLHSPTLMLFACWLIGMWASPEKAENLPRALWLSPRIWRGIGLTFMGMAGLLAVGAVSQQPWLNGTVTRGSLALLRGETGEAAPSEEPERWLRQASVLYPLEWTVHSAKARAAIARGDPAAAQIHFRRARLVCQDMGEVTWNESLFWRSLGASSQLLDAWRETFLERRMYDDGNKFVAVVRSSASRPILLNGLAIISRGEPRLRQLFFSVRTSVTARELERELAQNPRFAPWDRARRRDLFWSVGNILGWERLHRHFSEHPGLSEKFPYLREIAREEITDWETSGNTLANLVPTPPVNNYGSQFSLEELRALARRSPGDAAVVSALIREEVKSEGWSELLGTLEAFRRERHVAEPRGFRYWRALALTRLGRERAAGEAWMSYLREVEAGD